MRRRRYGALPGSTDDRGDPDLREVILSEGDDGVGFRTRAELIELGRAIGPEGLADAQAVTDPDDVINIQYTSGTTGLPKGAMLTRSNVLGNADPVGSPQNLTCKEVVCAPVPFWQCCGCVRMLASYPLFIKI